ncbi:hypothetical protein [Nonomuraea turcica]|uniref:hypothetical protein n=1 Tax=Nonomuraea sp. G32 TaxID=3067274 RepID=UPI00273BF9FF|nr:hypothetical protein [Nonomuraea sp. G32]MDP4505828.1 hypothetical protein [Nonomuraea sp. G32]
MYSIRAAVGFLVLSLALAACTATGETSTADPFASYDRVQSGVGDAALLTGTLVLDQGCLYADSDGQRWLPVFPAAGTQWDATAQTLTVDGRTAALGKTVELGGGTAQAEIITSAPEGCDRSQIWLVVSVGT